MSKPTPHPARDAWYRRKVAELGKLISGLPEERQDEARDHLDGEPETSPDPERE